MHLPTNLKNQMAVNIVMCAAFLSITALTTLHGNGMYTYLYFSLKFPGVTGLCLI